jgi:hypothetical protein
LKVAIIEDASQHHQQELRHFGFLQALAGSRRRHQVPNGPEGSVRQRRGRRLSSLVRHQRMLHGPIRTHHHATSDLQRSGFARRRLLVCVFDFFSFVNVFEFVYIEL